MACLGPKCSIYYMIISIWGIIMLALMGIFFQIRSVALFEDLKVDEHEWAAQNYSREFIQVVYQDNAINCWIAAGIYVLLFIFAFIQQRLNARQSYETS
ncbi:ribonuclease kappa-B-like [Physella acuta]|uniref:ribonuclease kappa-B-like n=1 Tax=Physella acuta TaxID=109671 RepID=UPI0027DBEA81|nr:ribonuclease kappa-B-like [Physella acuta]